MDGLSGMVFGGGLDVDGVAYNIEAEVETHGGDYGELADIVIRIPGLEFHAADRIMRAISADYAKKVVETLK